jgi:hypothetical protein
MWHPAVLLQHKKWKVSSKIYKGYVLFVYFYVSTEASSSIYDINFGGEGVGEVIVFI